jgi:hypothetical protein
VIGALFRAMNTKIEDRAAANLPRWANMFPYVNGGLFSGGLDVPRFSRIARSYLLHIGNLDWTKINPDIFGSMIQAVADDDERGALGMHYALEISALVDRLLSSDKTVVLIMPLLNIGFDLPQRWIENQVRAGRAIDEWKIETDPGLMMSGLRAEIAQILYKHRDNPRLVTVDPLSEICEQDYCYLVRNGQANFRDTAHISNVNAIQYRGLFDAAFRSALHAGTEAEEKTD